MQLLKTNCLQWKEMAAEKAIPAQCSRAQWPRAGVYGAHLSTDRLSTSLNVSLTVRGLPPPIFSPPSIPEDEVRAIPNLDPHGLLPAVGPWAFSSLNLICSSAHNTQMSPEGSSIDSDAQPISPMVCKSWCSPIFYSNLVVFPQVWQGSVSPGGTLISIQHHHCFIYPYPPLPPPHVWHTEFLWNLLETQEHVRVGVGVTSRYKSPQPSLNCHSLPLLSVFPQPCLLRPSNSFPSVWQSNFFLSETYYQQLLKPQGRKNASSFSVPFSFY